MVHERTITEHNPTAFRIEINKSKAWNRSSRAGHAQMIGKRVRLSVEKRR
jgi:hypothetical protein